MASSSIFQLISKKLVKPSSSTPPSLRNYKLSLFDQHVFKRYMPIAFFYPDQQKYIHRNNNATSQTSFDLLEKSLSKTLSYYYPFAGRLTDNISMNCNDMGATFLEARIRSPMSEVLANGRDIVFPNGLAWDFGNDTVVAQLNHFDCGGKALSVCLKHDIADGHTLCQFVNDWAAITRQSSEKPSPQFIGGTILPPIDDPSFEAIDFKLGKNNITKRYIFDSKIISQLKSKATADNSTLQKPTRVEVVSALLYKCAMSAASQGSFKPSVLISMMNLRSLIGPPVTQTYAGNLISQFPVLTTNETEINFSRLVTEIKKGKIQQYEKYNGMTTTALISSALDSFAQMKAGQAMTDMDAYLCTSLCGFPTHNIDFGWGSPIRVNLGAPPFKNIFILADLPNGDGIEAAVTLEEQVMSVFESDPEILALANSSTS